MKPEISIIMPAYNEGWHIFKNIRETQRVLDDIKISYEIIVVDDGSKDNTLEEVKRAAFGFDNIIVKNHRKNYGKGRTLKMGFRFTKGQYILFFDADLDIPPIQIQVLLDIMKLKNVDVVIGSKRHPDSVVNYPWHRKIVSSVYYFFIKILFGLPIRDTQTGIKLFKREVLEKVFHKILVKQYAYDVEILVLAHHYNFKIAEAPVILHFQREFSRVNLNDIYITWWNTMAIFYRMHILRYYDRRK